jgi:guanosine-3',5'-bis(diphosphate) 3'-pyrophosphohydrolase
MSDRFGLLVEKIKEKNITCDFDLLEKAYGFALTAHGDQRRESGEPFIVHPIEVAIILAELELDCTSIIAALLHDIIEDTKCTYERIKEQFGEDVVSLVDGVTKLGQIQYSTKVEQQAENFRKMFLAMAKDIRVIMIKLADRLHNMRTLSYMPAEKQLEKARESLEIYAPLAHRLGIFRIKWELEDISLRYIDPKGYYELVEGIAQKRKEREEFLNQIIQTLTEKIKELNIEYHIEGRPKNFYSIYSKMKEQGKNLDQIYDIFAIRIIVGTVKDCYAVLGLVHDLYKPIPGRFKDYIAMPKPNMYQSLHTTLMSRQGRPFEVQIRTWEMHRVAEVGIAAHWRYKQGGGAPSDLDNKLAWLRQLLEWQKEMKDANEFMETLKIDLFTDEVFVFTPKGDVVNLPRGSNPIDFAYAIHSAVGNKMVGAKVNGRIVPLGYELKNGDIVEILTSSSSRGPSRDWLGIVKSSQARSKINQWFKREGKQENIERGKEIVERELKKQGLEYSQLFREEWVDAALKRYNFSKLDDAYAAIGFGSISANKIISRLKEEYRKAEGDKALNRFEKKKLSKNGALKEHVPERGIIVKGIDNCLVRLSRCCNPVPGDSIVGYITRGRGVSVHRKDCPNVRTLEQESGRLIDVNWYSAGNVAYTANITVLANDRTALLMEITNCIGEDRINLTAINARTNKDRVAVINLTIEITDTEQLERLIKELRMIPDVFEVTRTKS